MSAHAQTIQGAVRWIMFFMLILLFWPTPW